MRHDEQLLRALRRSHRSRKYLRIIYVVCSYRPWPVPIGGNNRRESSMAEIGRGNRRRQRPSAHLRKGGGLSVGPF